MFCSHIFCACLKFVLAVKLGLMALNKLQYFLWVSSECNASFKMYSEYEKYISLKFLMKPVSNITSQGSDLYVPIEAPGFYWKLYGMSNTSSYLFVS